MRHLQKLFRVAIDNGCVRFNFSILFSIGWWCDLIIALYISYRIALFTEFWFTASKRLKLGIKPHSVPHFLECHASNLRYGFHPDGVLNSLLLIVLKRSSASSKYLIPYDFLNVSNLNWIWCLSIASWQMPSAPSLPQRGIKIRTENTSISSMQLFFTPKSLLSLRADETKYAVDTNSVEPQTTHDNIPPTMKLRFAFSFASLVFFLNLSLLLLFLLALR